MIPLPAGFEFRELRPDDVPDALDLIKSHHHDDYESASESYANSLNGQFVLIKDGQVMGVTGARKIPGTDRSFWLSWTYLDPHAAMQMDKPIVLFEFICQQLRQRANARKLFAMISPGVDSGLGGAHAYGGALKSYTEFGFQTELTHRDYYEVGESMMVLSSRLDPEMQTCSQQPETRKIGIFDSDEIAETDDAYFAEWDFMDGRIPPENDVCHWINKVRDWEGRVLFIGLPSHAETAIRDLTSQGFTNDGVLTDFYEDGLDEVRLRFDL